jgi:hypothetical protein
MIAYGCKGIEKRLQPDIQVCQLRSFPGNTVVSGDLVPPFHGLLNRFGRYLVMGLRVDPPGNSTAYQFKRGR